LCNSDSRSRKPHNYRNWCLNPQTGQTACGEVVEPTAALLKGIRCKIARVVLACELGRADASASRVADAVAEQREQSAAAEI
jgi:hypothetical protein